LVLGHYTKMTLDQPEYGLLTDSDVTALDEVAIYDGTDAPDWANSREWYIRGKYELEWNDPETACFYERIDY
jgi:hypothetical protein